MSETICVLGLDAADYRLATRWQCDNLTLENCARLDSITHSLDVPTTLEVWPTIATGKSPAEHGVTLEVWPTIATGKSPAEHGVTLDSVGWNNTAGLDVLVRAAQLLPAPVSERLAALKDAVSEDGHPYTDEPTVFDGGSVRNWPGVTPALDWERAGEWFARATDGAMSTDEFTRRYLGSTGACVGWLGGQSRADVPIAGVHAHILDHMGHMYARRPAELRAIYERVDELVGWLRSRVDRLVVVSDHGMQTTATDDPDPGVHSDRAMIATTEPGPLPTDVLSVRDWLEDRIDSVGTASAEASVDAPRDHLEDLGYL